MEKIKIGDEFITKSKGDAWAGYVLVVKGIEKNENKRADDYILFETTDMKYNKRGSAVFKTNESKGRRWWVNEYCQKIER